MDKKIDYYKIYSPSKLELFTQCPKAYHFTYLDPIYCPMKNQLRRLPHNIWSFHTLGKAVHSAITLFYHAPLEQRTQEQLKEHLLKSWTSEAQWNKKPPLGKWGGFETLEEERSIYRQALLMLTNFYKIAEIEPQIEFLPTDNFKNSIEDYQQMITPLNQDYDISGKFDLITREGESLHVIDFKTDKREKENPFQLRFYKLLAEENFKKLVKKASFYFLRTGNKKDFDLEVDPESIKEELIGKIEKIKSTQNFTTKPSKLCQFCLFKTFCPDKEKVSEATKGVKDEDYSDALPF